MNADASAQRVVAEADQIARDIVELEHASLLDVLQGRMQGRAAHLAQVAEAAQDALLQLHRATVEFEAARLAVAARVGALGLLAAPRPDGTAQDTATDGRTLTLRGTHWAPLDPADIVRKTANYVLGHMIDEEG